MAINVTKAKTLCKCGHPEFLHGMEAFDKQCSQCLSPPFCYDFTPQTREEIKDESTKQREEDSPKSSTTGTQSQSQELKPQQQPVSTGQRDEDGIRAAAELALRKLDEADAKAQKDHDKIEADDEKRKSDIVKEFAKDLEGKISTESIAAEIVHQLVDAEKARHGKSKVSKRLIYKCLDLKYRRQWQKHKDEDQEQSALVHFDKKEVTPVIISGGRNETLQEEMASPQVSTQTTDGEPEQDIAKPASSNTSVMAAKTQLPQPEQVSAKESSQQQLQQPQQQLRILIDWDELSDKMSELHYKDIKNFWLCGRIENGKLLDIVLERS